MYQKEQNILMEQTAAHELNLHDTPFSSVNF